MSSSPIKKIVYFKEDGSIWELDGEGAKTYEQQMLEATEFCSNHGKTFRRLPWRDVKSNN